MKLNLGSGDKMRKDWVNVDVKRPEQVPDGITFVEADVRKLPFEEGTVETIEALHLIEHFYPWEVPPMLAEWRRVLKEGGTLVLECPDMAKCAINFLQLRTTGNTLPAVNLGLWGFYGNPVDKEPLNMHKWGWVPESLMQILILSGFKEVREEPQQQVNALKGPSRDMRVVGVR